MYNEIIIFQLEILVVSTISVRLYTHACSWAEALKFILEFFILLFKKFLFEREKERAHKWGRDRGRGESKFPTEQEGWCDMFQPRIPRSWPNWRQTLNPWSYLGTLLIPLLMLLGKYIHILACGNPTFAPCSLEHTSLEIWNGQLAL